MKIPEVLGVARQSGVKLIRFEYCDVSGVARAKAVHVAQLAHKLVEGVGLTRAQMSISLLEQLIHVDGMEPVGEIRLVPDPATFTVLPWAPASASVLCDQLDHDRKNWGACTRSYLKDMIARAADAGISVQATFENEYYLAKEEDGRFTRSTPPVMRRSTAQSATTWTRPSWCRRWTRWKPREWWLNRRSTSSGRGSAR
jgi:glutamine synthetase